MDTDCRIIDTTLREGEQAPGVCFTAEEKRCIIDGLVRIGVTEVELGVAASLTENQVPLVRFCRERHPSLRLSLWGRCLAEDIEQAALAGVDTVSLSMPVSDLLLETKLGRNRRWAEQTAGKAVHRARELGLSVAVGFEDATRADRAFFLELAARVEEAGAWRIRLADTVGIASPQMMTTMVCELDQVLHGAQIAVHTHNDFGLATANALAALDAGADWVDAAILGLGERCGCARLEEVVGYLVLVRGVPGLSVVGLSDLATDVAAMTGRAVSPWAPVTGASIFTCESGLHLHGLLIDPRTYEPYPPELVGARRRLQVGAKSGRAAMRHLLTGTTDNDCSISAEQACQVRHRALQLGRGMNRDELAALLKR
ncbi:MAG: pyruvate carboxyltransferase [Desulfofustis sp.]|nr:pyruvate carboxyltransferase [Desulfofustis sp.]